MNFYILGIYKNKICIFIYMINKLFYSDGNRNAIKSVINDNIFSNSKVNINNNFDNIINDTMQYVNSQVSQTPPKGVNKDEYLFLMNKKVYDIVTPIIKTSLEKNKRKPIIENPPINKLADKKVSNKVSDNIFDPLLLRQFEIPSVMDYPKPGAQKSNTENTNIKIKSLEDERSILTPKIRPIDFTLKEVEKPANTLQLYNEMVSNMTNFETSQKGINDIIDKIELPEQSSFTPIDLLKNKQETNIFLKNSSYNRNDIETFINPDYTNDSTSFQNIFEDLNQTQIDPNRGKNMNYQNIDNVMINEPKFKLIQKKFFIIFDSADRDLYEYPNPSSFQVKFSPAGNNLKYDSYYDQYSTLIVREKTIVYGDGSNLSVQETFDNINNIMCKSVNVPTNIIYLGSTEPQSGETGTPLNIFKDSYLYLVIPELRGPYRGGNLLAYNSFAKLLIDFSSNTTQLNTLNMSNFTTLKTADENETFMYDPVSAGKIDKMTLNLVNKNGRPYNFGIDKLFIESFMEGTYRYDGYCGDKYLTTIINIQNMNDEYIKYCSLYYKSGQCNLLNSHPINSGDLLYFYDTTPNNDQIVFLEDYVNITKLKYIKNNNKLQIYVGYVKIIDNDEKTIPVNLKNIISGAELNNYIVIFDTKTNKNYFLKIYAFNDTFVTVDYLDVLPKFKDYSSLRIGIAKSNPRGSNNEDIQSLFNKFGYNVINVGNTIDNQWSIEIDFPYKNLPIYLKDASYYTPGEIFLIQEKMQISYTFTVTIMTKDYQQLKSELNDSGNN